ncbi:MAG: glycosyltransferase family 4 protein [Nitrospinota bacterium]|nr:glycosyltransferase family 4 protein [Nitrospinota bacterium]
MKLLLCAPVYPPSVGGVQTLSARIAGELSERGHEVQVIARGISKDSEIDKENKLVRVLRISFKPFISPILFYFVLFRRPQVLLLTHRADFLRFAILIKKIFRIPFVVIIHGNEIYGSPRKEKLKESLNKSSALIAVSEYTKNRLVSLGFRDDKIFSIRNGVSYSNFGPDSEGEILREDLGFSENKILLSVGRLQLVKGFDCVIRSLPIIVKKYPNIVYVLVGDGPEMQNLKTLAKELDVSERVVFVGEIPYGKMGRGRYAYYQACDIFLMPSRIDYKDNSVEAFGIAHLEAGACGKPVIGGFSGGSPEAVLDGENGFLVNPENPDEIASAVLKIFNSPSLSDSMGEKGKELARESNWSNVVKNYEKLLLQIVKPEA